MIGPQDLYDGLATDERSGEDALRWGSDEDPDEPDALSDFRSWLDDPE